MPKYAASFRFILPAAIKSDDTSLPPLTTQFTEGTLSIAVSLAPDIDGDLVKALSCQVLYEEQTLMHASYDPADPAAAIEARLAGGRRLYAPLDALPTIWRVLQNLSALTLQWEVFSRSMVEELDQRVQNLSWQTPDGRKVPGIPVSGLMLGLYDLPDPSRRNMSASDWASMQRLLDGTGPEAPLWRIVLADAHCERARDIRNVVLKCATALDIVLQPLIDQMPNPPPPRKKRPTPLEALRGEKGSRTPDLRVQNAGLHDDLAQLWYTRHAIIHRGSNDLFTKNPQSGAQPLRRLQRDDAERFLRAVPLGVSHAQNHPP